MLCESAILPPTMTATRRKKMKIAESMAYQRRATRTNFKRKERIKSKNGQVTRVKSAHTLVNLKRVAPLYLHVLEE